ncbi:hypothetical protein Dimus_022181 [Dionaea muscipula]
MKDKGKEVDVVAKESEKVDEARRKTGTIATQLVPETEIRAIAGTENKGRRTRSKGKAGDGMSGQGKLPPSLELLPSELPIDPSAPSLTTSKPLSYTTAKWTLMQHYSVLLAGADKAAKEALSHEWTRGAMMAKDQSVCKNLDDVSLNELMTQAAVQCNIFWSESRASEAEEKEKKARDEAKLYRSQLIAMEQNHVRAHNEATAYKAKAEAATEALNAKDAKIASLIDDIRNLTNDKSNLEQ